MPYTPLTSQQYQKAISAGFSPDAILQMEKQRKFTENTQQPEEKFWGGQTGQQFTSQPMIKQIAQAFVATLPKDFADFFVNAPVKAALSTGEALSLPFTKGKPQGITAGQIPVINKIPGLDKNMTGRVSESQQALDTGKKPFGWHSFVSPMIGAAMDGLITAQELKSVVGVSAKLFGDAPLNDLSKGTQGIIPKITGQVVGKTKEVVGQGISKGVSNLKDIAYSGKNLKAVNAELANQPLQKLDLNNQIRDLRISSKGTIQEMTDTFQTTNQVLQDTLANEAKLQASQNQGTLKTLFEDMSKTYKMGLNQTEKTMASRGKSLQSSYFSEVIDNTLKTAKDYGVEMHDPTVRALMDVQATLKKTAGKPLSLDKMIILKNKIYSASQMGKDFVNDAFMRNYGSFLEKFAPELKALNKEFTPMIQAKGWAIKTFKPYNADEIQKGANALMQIANGKVPNQTSINYLETLSKGSGGFKGAGNLTGKTTEIGSEIKNTKGLFNVAKQDLMRSTDFQINKLQTEIASLQKRGIELGQRAKQLNDLKKIRNIIIGTVLAGTVLKGTASKVLQVIP